jgi:alginate O-acetyltransferase complex protein AlgI
MLFNSLEFLPFFLTVYALYWVLPFRWQNRMLLVAGYIFYGLWDIRFLFLIACSTTVDFTIGLLLREKRMPVPQRWIASSFLVGAALIFLCPNWAQLLSFADRAPVTDAEHVALIQSFGIKVLIATIVFVGIANFLIDRVEQMSLEQRGRLLIFCSVLVNLTFLGIFKYFNFFVDSAAEGLRALGIDPTQLQLHIVLPVGISFYTFQSLSYTIDVFRGRVKATTRFWDFALFVAYFPPLVAGPIERGHHLLPQLLRPRRIRLVQSAHGIVLVLLGLFKKVAIADGLAPVVDAIYSSPGKVSQFDVAAATLFFAIQIFCDFSGYSDVARGVSKLLGIDLILNFNLPYFSKNPSEFWSRWHISLSTWLRDYLYIPLGGNRRGRARTYANLLMTMLLGGLWHGASWNYVLWGGYQGTLLCLHRLFTAGRDPPSEALARGAGNHTGGRTQRLLSTWPLATLQIGGFFLLTCYGWLLFRAHSFERITTFTLALFGLGEPQTSLFTKPTTAAILGTALLIGLQICDYRAGKLESFMSWPPPIQGVLYAVLFFIFVMGTSNAPIQFIYFQF